MQAHLTAPLSPARLTGPSESDLLNIPSEPPHPSVGNSMGDTVGDSGPARLTGPSEMLCLTAPAEPARLTGPSEMLYLTAQAEPVRIIGPSEPRLTGAPAASARITAPWSQLHLATTAAVPVATCAGSTSSAEGTYTSGAPIAVFQPSYEWQELSSAAVIPAGLNVDLPLDGGVRRARIPRKWQLRLWIDDEHGFWRYNDVTRGTTMAALRQAVAQHTHCDARQITLSLGGVALRDGSTAEDVKLFSKTKELTVTLGAD